MELKTPVRKEDVLRLRAGDVVYLSGEIFTARDRATHRILEMLKEGKRPPVELNGAAIYHCGPIARREGDKWRIIAAGPTTSARLNEATEKLLEHVETIALIGKGGMSSGVRERLRGRGIYLAYPGGAGVLASERILEVKDVYWEDLGMPEALWVLRVEKFGPLIVGIDAHGKSIYEEVEKRVKERFEKMIEGR
ncbi:MAG: fumarate hydratase C-terminal domain-containing protein [Archaeoglobi archaeon]|nr:fumarate hydratase C-terminal domain-containing protein [Candidatus Mnemosynella bozhongmuii]